MLRPWTFVGFTGHRTLENPLLTRSRIVEALRQIAIHTQSPLAALSSAAAGADTLFAEACAEKEMPWVLLLPFPKQSFFNSTDFSPADLERIEPLVAKATQVHVESAQELPLSTEDLRTEAFKACSTRTVDECDYLLAVWNGEAGKPGGTGDTVAYAREQNKPLVLIDARTGALTTENFPQATTPDSTASEPPRPLDSLQGGLPELEATLAHYDREAGQHAPEARDLVTRVIFLHLLATAVGLFAPVFGILTWVAMLPAVFKVGVLSYAGGLAHRQQHAKTQWLRHRLIAELCRAAVSTWCLPYSDRIHQPIEIPGLRHWQRSLSLWRLAAPPAPRSLAEQRDAYLRARFDSPQTGQLPYFQKQHQRASARYQRWHRIAQWSTSLAITCALAIIGKALYLAFSPGHGPAHHVWWADALKYLSLVLPLLSAAIFTWLASSDCRRRVERNAAILASLAASRERIQKSTSLGALTRQASEVETVLLLEILEWHSISHFTADAH